MVRAAVFQAWWWGLRHGFFYSADQPFWHLSEITGGAL